MHERETQTIEDITAESLPTLADAFKLDGWRLVQILCIARVDGYELQYSFGGGYALRTLRLNIGPRQAVPSITPYYGAAFLYENEIRDLFGALIERISPDWEGKVFDVAGTAPFSKLAVPLTSSERPEAAPILGVTHPPAAANADGGAR
jgi:ech hydrogenase subunit D